MAKIEREDFLGARANLWFGTLSLMVPSLTPHELSAYSQVIAREMKRREMEDEIGKVYEADENDSRLDVLQRSIDQLDSEIGVIYDQGSYKFAEAVVNQWGGQEGFSFGDFTNEIKDRARDLMEYPMGLDREEAEHLALFEVSSIAGNGFVNSPALADSFKGLARQVKELDICRSARIKAVGFYAGDIK